MNSIDDIEDLNDEYFKMAFMKIDRDNTGIITEGMLVREYIKNFDYMHHCMCDLIMRIMKKLDQEEITLEEFTRYMKQQEDELKQIFKRMDTNKDHKIDADELKKAVESIENEFQLTESRRLIAKLDKNKDGAVDYAEWREFLIFTDISNVRQILRYWRRAPMMFQGFDLAEFTLEEKKSGYYRMVFWSGAFAGLVSRTCTAPIDRLKIIWQAYGTKVANKGIKHTIQKMIRNGGILSMWRGNLMNCTKVIPENGAKLYLFERFKKSMEKGDDSLSVYQKFFAGSAAGVMALSIVFPFEVMKIRMALRHTSMTPMHCLKKIYRKQGLLGFYRGYFPTVAGVIPYAGIDLALYEQFKLMYIRRYLTHDKSVATAPPYISLGCGACSSLCGQLATYPLALIKTKMQSGKTRKNFWGILKRTITHEGPRGLYCGFVPQALKVVPTVGIFYSVFEWAKQNLFSFLQ